MKGFEEPPTLIYTASTLAWRPRLHSEKLCRLHTIIPQASPLDGSPRLNIYRDHCAIIQQFVIT